MYLKNYLRVEKRVDREMTSEVSHSIRRRLDVSEVILRSTSKVCYALCFVVCESFSQITRVNDFQQQKEKENKKHYRRQFVAVWFLANNFIDSFPFFRQKTLWQTVIEDSVRGRRSSLPRLQPSNALHQNNSTRITNFQ